jgi:Tfp pilus assembly protein PilZ
MGGMCVCTEDSIEEKQEGVVALEYECDGERLHFTGEFVICWIKPLASDGKGKQIGLQFTYYDSKNLTTLARIIITQVSRNENKE